MKLPEKLIERHVAVHSDSVLCKEIIVESSLERVWQAWTTTVGVKTFFSKNAMIDLAVGGQYEILFDMDSPLGSRGSEECKVLSFLPMEMLSFEWNAPPDFGELRNQLTHVVILFDVVEAGQIRVRLSHLGWGKGGRWDELYEYFDTAWSRVLEWFADSMTSEGIEPEGCCD